MPDLMTHVWFSRQVAKSLPEEIASLLEPDLLGHGAAGPDVWFTCGFYGTPAKAMASRGGQMHENKTGAFLTALAERCRRSPEGRRLFSYLAGYLCHYALDRTAHPYIVSRTGNYTGAPETLPYRGNHMRLERGIDAYIIRRKYHCDPARFPLGKMAVPLTRFPRSMEKDLDAVYDQVYGWKNTWAALNRALRDQRLFYTLLQDPVGLIAFITKKADNGVAGYDYSLMSYHGRDLDSTEVDYLNLGHRPWRHYADPSIVHTESFPELVEEARRLAAEYITVIYNYVYRFQGTPSDVFRLLGNVSYTSGFECSDERNFGKFTFDPIF